MKFALLLLFLACSLTTVSSNANNEFNPDQEVSDLIYKHFSREEYNIPKTKADLAGLPVALSCGENSVMVLAELAVDQNDQVIDYGPGLFTSNIDSDSLLIDNSDGDQVGMMKMKISELKALAKGEVSSILALTADGFWWADGDHIDGSTATCKLAKSRQIKSIR